MFRSTRRNYTPIQISTPRWQMAPSLGPCTIRVDVILVSPCVTDLLGHPRLINVAYDGGSSLESMGTATYVAMVWEYGAPSPRGVFSP